MLRIALFLLTNLAVILVASISLSLLGFDGYLQQNGVDLNLSGLLVFCAIFGMAGALISLLISKWMAKRAMGVYIIERPRNQSEQWLVNSVAEISRKAGIGMPEVGIFESNAANAFATGWQKDNALVALSTGMLERFDEDEIEAVIGHEIGHVANGDMVTLSLIQGVVNTFVMFFARIIGHAVDRLVFRNEHGHGIGFYVVTIIAEICLGIFASMIVARFSRWREFRADAAGAELVHPQSMINALRRLQSEQQYAAGMSDELVAFGIRADLKSGLMALLSTHPPLDQRIDALRAAYR